MGCSQDCLLLIIIYSKNSSYGLKPNSLERNGLKNTTLYESMKSNKVSGFFFNKRSSSINTIGNYSK